MSHNVSALLVALFLYGIFTKPWLTNWHWQVYLGLAIAMAAWVRPQDVLFLLAPILMGAILIEREHARTNFQAEKSVALPNISVKSLCKIIIQRAYWQPLLVMLTVAVLMQLPQIFIYLWQYGGIGKIPYLEEGQASGHGGSFNWLQPALWQVLFSGYRGLFTWHPITLVSIIGLGLTWRLLPRLNSILLITFLAQVYFIASWWSWWQGASVGGRMFANCTFLFVFGLASLWQKNPSRQWQKWGLGITIFLIFWNLLIIMQYQSAMIPPEAPITLRELYQNQFRIIPFFINHLLNKF
jgi:hypothetical protein